jgi:hypothetical protein
MARALRGLGSIGGMAEDGKTNIDGIDYEVKRAHPLLQNKAVSKQAPARLISANAVYTHVSRALLCCTFLRGFPEPMAQSVPVTFSAVIGLHCNV